MAYRDDVAALEARVAALSADLAVRERERDEAARLLAEARVRADADAYLADLASGGPARRRRKRLRIAALAAGLVMIVGGLFAYRARHHDDRFEREMRTFERFTDEMCACKDNACAQHVSDDMTKWAQQVEKDWQPMPKFDEAQMKRANDMGMRMARCMQTAMSVGDPSQLGQ
ncbi:MAG: hypothetical protein JO257_04670 [Deltaproteobacteria bacterium]|nr:hypothetical protein [Deltaproteobacteria bacterium]